MILERLLALLTEKYWLPPISLAVLFGFVLLLAYQRSRELKQSLGTAPAALASWNPEEPPLGENDVWRFARQYLLSPEPVTVPGWPQPRFLVSKSIDDILDAYVERRTATKRFAVGPLATGAALVCTFFLIALVLQIDVHHAIGSTGSTELAGAVRTLGVKFYISASGIALSILFALSILQFRKTLHAAAHETAVAISSRFCTPSTFSAGLQLALLREAEVSRTRDEDRWQARNQQHAELQAALEGIRDILQGTRTDLEKLRSIEVSVKDLGAEVTAKMQQMLTQDLGEQIQGILADAMRQLDDLSEKLQAKILEGFSQTVERQVPRIIESLEAIQRSVESQAQSPVERLLEQLQGVVAGGFRGESAQMSAALRQFAEVVPALAAQLRETAQNLTTEMRSRADENARTNEALIRQVTELLFRLEAQQAATEKLVNDIGQAASASAESLVQRVKAESRALFDDLLRSSRNDIEELLARLREATKESSDSYSSIEASVAATSRAILEARDGLYAAAQAIRQLSADTHSVIAEARQTHEVAQQASQSFDRAANQLREGVEAMRSAVESARTHATEQAKLLEAHQRQLADLERIWPRLFETYVQSFDRTSQELLRSWDEFYNKTRAFSQTVGGSLADAAEDLRVAVDRLANHQQQARR
mgnify:CR=1 FL=1